MENKLINGLSDKIINGYKLKKDEALSILKLHEPDIFFLLAEANKVKYHFKGNVVNFCSIINAKSGKCSEDCTFCAQSAHNKATVDVYPLLPSEKIVECALKSFQSGAREFGIVTSGKGIKTDKDIEEIAKAIAVIKENSWGVRCASLGILSTETLLKLKEAGLEFVHHNLETSENFFPKVCTTHKYEERIKHVKNVKNLGLKLCSGGIFGIGEGDEDRVDLAFTLKELNVDSIPLNFLNPIEGTPAADNLPLHPMKILKIIAMFRLINPMVNIRVCGGREKNLRSLQPLIFIAGANGALIGNYLTTIGRPPEEDLDMISDLGLVLDK